MIVNYNKITKREWDLYQIIHDKALEYADVDMDVPSCCSQACKDLGLNEETAKWATEVYVIQSALDAGIPLSVIERKTKLTDHFSKEYIKSQGTNNASA